MFHVRREIQVSLCGVGKGNEVIDERLLLLQMAFALVGDSTDYVSMSIDSRVDEVKRVYKQFLALIDPTVEVARESMQ